MTTGDVFLPCINPVDQSYPNTNSTDPGPNNPPIGGLLGDGDLTSDDGDTSGWEAWNANTSNVGDPGVDRFDYSLDTSALPAGATLTAYRFEMVDRLVVGSPQGFPYPVGPGASWSTSPALLVNHGWTGTAADFTYALRVGDTRTMTAELVGQLADGTAVIGFGLSPRVGDELAAVRCTMAGLRVYYTLPDPPLATHALPLRQFPRTDGLATSSARRMWPPSRSYQRSNRRAGGYL